MARIAAYSGAEGRLLLAVDVTQQAQPGAGPEASGRSGGTAEAGRGSRCFHYELSATGARPAWFGGDGPAAAESAANLRVLHGVWRRRRGSGENRFRLDGVLGA